jgi:predicted ester cyclase
VESDNERLVRRFVDAVVNRGETELLPLLVAADHVGHDPLGDHYGPMGMRIAIGELRAAFPDLRVSIEDVVAAGDRVVHRFALVGTHGGPFLGLPPTGRHVTATGLAIDRVAGGKLAERWIVLDAIGLLRQLGAAVVLGQRWGERPATFPPKADTTQ